MATMGGESIPDTGAAEAAAAAASEAAERLAEAAGEAAGAAGEALGGLEGEGGNSGDAWSFWFRALMTIVVVMVCFVATRVIRGENPEDKRLRLRAERRAKKKAGQAGPDEIDKLLSSIVRRQPGQAPPAGAVPISGRGMPRGMPPGGVGGRGAGPAASAARAAAAGRGNGAGRGPPPPPGADNRPKLRWDQNNEEVEIVIRVDPKVARGDVKVEVTGTMLKLSLRGQTVIAGHLFKQVDPEGCTWQIEDPGPGHPKEVMITLLKAEPAKNRESWWRAPLKGLETRGGPPVRRPASQPADPEMVRKAIEAIKAKSGGVTAKPGVKLGAKPLGGPASATSPRAGSGAAANAGGAPPVSPRGVVAPAITAGPGETAGAGTATVPVADGVTPTKPGTGKANKGGGKKKNRKKK